MKLWATRGKWSDEIEFWENKPRYNEGFWLNKASRYVPELFSLPKNHTNITLKPGEKGIARVEVEELKVRLVE